jgi:hypothetical protein
MLTPMGIASQTWLDRHSITPTQGPRGGNEEKHRLNGTFALPNAAVIDLSS